MMDRGAAAMIGSGGTAPDRDTAMFRRVSKAMRHRRRAARGLGLADRIGGLEAARPADIITVDLAVPRTPVHRALRFASGADMREVASGGGVRMQGRTVLMWTRPPSARRRSARPPRCPHERAWQT